MLVELQYPHFASCSTTVPMVLLIKSNSPQEMDPSVLIIAQPPSSSESATASPPQSIFLPSTLSWQMPWPLWTKPRPCFVIQFGHPQHPCQ
jgi:hypothetical protein